MLQKMKQNNYVSNKIHIILIILLIVVILFASVIFSGTANQVSSNHCANNIHGLSALCDGGVIFQKTIISSALPNFLKLIFVISFIGLFNFITSNERKRRINAWYKRFVLFHVFIFVHSRRLFNELFSQGILNSKAP